MGGMWGGTEVSWGACGEALRCVGACGEALRCVGACGEALRCHGGHVGRH